MKRLEKYLLPLILLAIVVVYTILVFLSEGTMGGADDMTHFRYSRYAFEYPRFFLHHWGKPVFTALSAPFAQFGYNGVRIFNVLAGTAAAWLTYRVAKDQEFSQPLMAIVLVIASPMYTVLMLSGMTEILFSLMLILSIFLFGRKHYIWSALVLSFIPFVRTEGVVILPLFFLALGWLKQWKALPFLLFGLVFYSLAGCFYYKDIFWVFTEMPYSGNARSIYGSGELLHYVKASKFIFGIPLAIMVVIGLLLYLLDPLLRRGKYRKEWIIRLLVLFGPFLVYYAAHSYVWWKGKGNSVGMTRVMAAVMPSAVLVALWGWNRIMSWIPVKDFPKHLVALAFSAFLLSIPFKMYTIPVPLAGEQRIVKQASDWLGTSEYSERKMYYYNPFFCHFMKLNPYDEDRVKARVYDPEHPEKKIREGEVVVWDAHFGPNEGRLPLERLMDNPAFRLIGLVRDREPFKVLGGYEYEIYIFERIMEDDGEDNHDIYQVLLDEILNAGE
jgi:hypothetical protein